jgi:hypothetical protein
MSQQLTPASGGVVPEVSTTVAQSRLNVLSEQYISVNNLQSRKTEWTLGGRPIYRRLPAISETYQIDFFNVVTESNILGNTFDGTGVEKVGYVYLPYGASIEGPGSAAVVAADTKTSLLLQAGVIVWEYGKTEVLPSIVDLEVLEVLSGKYDIAYQLIYDDSPVPELYSVEDFALTGLPLNITSSTDNVTGWRYPAENAFLNTTDLFWSNEDTLFPAYSQPATSFLQWESTLGQAYSKVVLRLPSGSAYSGTATLSYLDGTVLTSVLTVEVSKDTTGQYFEFTPEEAVMQNGWNIAFSSNVVSIQSVTVSGVLTLLRPQAAPSPRARLVMYPAGILPKTVEDSEGNLVPATYCTLAQVDVASNYTVLDINDTRSIIHRDYVPVADWLTKPFDLDLIDLYEQVSDYSALWMGPTTCLKQEYTKLETDQIQVEE